MDYRVIISKYKESLSWVHSLNFDLSKLIIYDKSNKPISNSIHLKNVGRESETFFRYITSNYDNLPDYIILLQGYPLDHFKSSKHGSLNDYILTRISTKPTDIIPLGITRKNRRHLLGLNLDLYYEYLLKDTPPTSYYYTIGSQYIIPKQKILNKPLSFWTNLHKMTYNSGNEQVETYKTTTPFSKNKLNPWSCEVLMPYFLH